MADISTAPEPQVDELTEVEKPEGKAEVKPLTKEEVAEMLTAEREQMKAEIEQTKRHFQSLTQQQVNMFKGESDYWKQRSSELETQVEAIEEHYFDNLDPEQQAKVLKEQFREIQKQRRRPASAPGIPATRQQPAPPGPQEILAPQVKALGIDPKDKRIDWAEEDRTVGGVQRFYGSLMKILAEDQKKLSEPEMTKIKKQVRDEVEKEWEVGPHAHVEGKGVRGVSGSDEDYLERFSRGEVHDMKRAKEILAKQSKGG